MSALEPPLPLRNNALPYSPKPVRLKNSTIVYYPAFPMICCVVHTLKHFFSCWEACTIYPSQLQAFFPGVYLLAVLEASGSTMQTGSILQKPHVTVEASGSPTQLWKPSEAMNKQTPFFGSLQKSSEALQEFTQGFQSLPKLHVKRVQERRHSATRSCLNRLCRHLSRSRKMPED